jgi:hypothetical protein
MSCRSPPSEAVATRPPLAHNSEAGTMREMPVHEASVGFFRNVRVDFVHDRRARRLVALPGSKGQPADPFESIVSTGHRQTVTAIDGVRNAP